MDPPFPGKDVGGPGDLLDEGGPLVEEEFVGLVGHQEVPVRDHVRHGRCPLLDLEVGGVTVCLLERGAAPRDHQPPVDRGSRREPVPPLAVREDEPVEHPRSLDHQVLVGVAGLVGVRAEFDDPHTAGCAGKEAEEQDERGDPAHTQGYVSPGLIGERYDNACTPAGRQGGWKPL